MENQPSSSKNVFISFRIEDTCGVGFIENLCKALSDKGIKTFMDDKENEITPSLVKDIQECRIAIIILSENYPSSSFCLEVLSSVVDNFLQNPKNRFIFPVFYDVDPSHVRNQSGPYQTVFSNHEKRLKENKQKVFKWRTALFQVAGLSSRLHFETRWDWYAFEKLIDKIVEVVSRQFYYNIDYPVGLESQLEEVYRCLELQYNNVIMLGIYGMGGIGKTFLAEAVYNMIQDQFEASCFLSVRKNSNINGLLHLQTTLLADLTRSKDIIQVRDVYEGISIIKQKLHQTKVLLVLDDVDTLEQLEALAGGLDWFGPGSRVIITTRDRHLLAFHGVKRTYEVQELNHMDALKLLSREAFKDCIVDPVYTELLNRAVTYASGLPLALKSIGATLCKKSVNQWGYILDKLERIPQKDIQKILRVSFDTLDREQKSIFLDIACCFIGYKLADVEDILQARYGHDLKYHIQCLIDKSLINISLDGKVTAHWLVEDMGKEIVRQESPLDPGRRSRLWFHDDIVQVLKHDKGSSNIEIIHLDSPLTEDEKEIFWDGKAFKKMTNLRILIIRKCHFSKAPKYLPNSLKVLEWWNYPSDKLPSDFYSKKLVICKPAELLKISHGVPEVSQSTKSDPDVLHRVSQAETTWRLVGLMSSVVGLSCYALSPCFNRLIGKWKAFKFFLYGVLSLAILTTILFAEQSSRSTRHFHLKTYTSFLVLMIISVYSFFYDRAVNEKPDILSVVSNAAFALVSLSLHKLISFGFEIGVFSYFLGCFTVQLLTINWMLIFVAIIFGCPLYVMHSAQNSRSEVASGRQVIPSSSQDVDIRQDLPSKGNGLDVARPEVASGEQLFPSPSHVVDMPRDLPSKGNGLDIAGNTNV